MKRRFRRRAVPVCLAERLEERLALATITVSNANNAGFGSLRDAITRANAGQGHDTIVFDPVFFGTPRTVSLTADLTQITSGTNSSVTIIGPGSSLLTIRRDSGAPDFEIFDCFAPALGLSGMTITGGKVSGNGAGVTVVGTASVTLDDVVITGNTAGVNGGGIVLGNDSTLLIRNSVISGNTARFGGGIVFNAGGALHMENCTVSGNTATGSGAAAGGIYFGGVARTNAAGFVPGTLVIRNSTIQNNTTTGPGGGVRIDGFTGTLLVDKSTISGNTAGGSGGGIDMPSGTGSIVVRNSTISGNTSGAAGGGIALLAGAGNITVQNSTITANRSTGTAPPFRGGGGIGRISLTNGTIDVINSVVWGNTDTVEGGGPNIRASTATTTNVNFSAVGYSIGFTLSGTSGNNLDPAANVMLGALENNFGATKTHAILPGSPLINAGSNALIPPDLHDLDGDGNTTEPLPFDQRGMNSPSGLTDFPRVSGAAVDIGAFELDVVRPTVTSAQFFWDSSSQALNYTFSENVGVSLFLNPSGLSIRNLTTSSDVPTSNVRFGYDTVVRTAYFNFAGYPNGALPDGNYRATLIAPLVTDLTGNSLPANHVFDFFVLAGDADRNRRVDFNDLVVLAQNYNQGGRSFSQGNFDYDLGGVVNFNDLVVLAQRYGTFLAPVAADAVLAGAELGSGSGDAGKPAAVRGCGVFNATAPVRRRATAGRGR